MTMMWEPCKPSLPRPNIWNDPAFLADLYKRHPSLRPGAKRARSPRVAQWPILK